MAPFPEREPEPVPPPMDGGDEYGVTPLPKHWSEMARPDEEIPEPEAYGVGEEVVEAPYHPEAKTWREIVAARNAPRVQDLDAEGRPYEVGPQTISVVRHTSRWAQFATDVATKLRANEDRRIGEMSDPRRFTLARLLFVFTLASVVLAVGARFPRGAFAGMTGLAVLVTALLSRWLLGGSAVAQLGWWTLMAIYLLASVFSLLNL